MATPANSTRSVAGASIWAVMPPGRPPAAVATSSTIPSRRLISRRPAVAAETALEVAMTVVRLMAAAAWKGTPTTSTRKGTRNTPPPRPRRVPSRPATLPSAMVERMRTGVRAGIVYGRDDRSGLACGEHDDPLDPTSRGESTRKDVPGSSNRVRHALMWDRDFTPGRIRPPGHDRITPA